MIPPSKQAMDEGSTCPSCGLGKLHFKEPENCFCHISAPCIKCVDAPLVCPECREEFDEALESYRAGDGE